MSFKHLFFPCPLLPELPILPRPTDGSTPGEMWAAIVFTYTTYPTQFPALYVFSGWLDHIEGEQ